MKQQKIDMICEELKSYGIVETYKDKIWISEKFLKRITCFLKGSGDMGMSLILTIVDMLKIAEENHVKEYYLIISEIEPIRTAFEMQNDFDKAGKMYDKL